MCSRMLRPLFVSAIFFNITHLGVLLTYSAVVVVYYVGAERQPLENNFIRLTGGTY